MAVDAEPYFAMNPELSVAPEELREFMRDIQGCVIGRELARRFGWKVGDRFFLESFVSGYRKPSGPFEFVIRGLMDADPRHPGTETELMVFHFKYLNEAWAATCGRRRSWSRSTTPTARPTSAPPSTPCSRTRTNRR